MKCPHCNADLLYRERGNRRCSKCQQEFAFEPKSHPLRLRDRRLVNVATKLSQNGTLQYTESQLYYTLIYKVIFFQQTSGKTAQMGCTIFLSLAAGFFAALFLSSAIKFPPFLPFIVFFTIVFGIRLVLMPRKRRRPVRPRLPVTFNYFQQDVIGRWQQIYHALPPGMFDSRQPLPADPPPDQQCAVLACLNSDILTCLRVNRVPEQLGIGLLPGNTGRTPAEEATLAALRADPRRPLLILHDASVEGCVLARSLPLALGLRPEHPVKDIGLHPRQAIQYKLLQLAVKPSPKLLRLLQKRVASSLPAAADGGLSHEEFDWLKQGFYTPLQAISPARLIRAVQQAVKRANPPQRTGPHERRAQRQAEAVGFLTWPE